MASVREEIEVMLSWVPSTDSALRALPMRDAFNSTPETQDIKKLKEAIIRLADEVDKGR